MTFQNADLSNKGVECRRIAGQMARAAMVKALDDATFYTECGNRLFGRQGAGRRLMNQWYRKAGAAKGNAIGWASR